MEHTAEPEDLGMTYFFTPQEVLEYRAVLDIQVDVLPNSSKLKALVCSVDYDYDKTVVTLNCFLLLTQDTKSSTVLTADNGDLLIKLPAKLRAPACSYMSATTANNILDLVQSVLLPRVSTFLRHEEYHATRPAA